MRYGDDNEVLCGEVPTPRHHPGDELAWRAYWHDAPDADHRIVLLCRLAFLAGRQSVRDEADAELRVAREQAWPAQDILAREG